MTISRAVGFGWTHWTRLLVSSLLFRHGRQVASRHLRQHQSAFHGNRIRLLTTQTTNGSIFGSQNLLPVYCPGCGAPSQASRKDEAGHYSPNRSAVKAYLGHGRNSQERKNEQDAIFLSALQDHRKDALRQDLAEAHLKQGMEIYS